MFLIVKKKIDYKTLPIAHASRLDISRHDMIISIFPGIQLENNTSLASVVPFTTGDGLSNVVVMSNLGQAMPNAVRVFHCWNTGEMTYILNGFELASPVHQLVHQMIAKSRWVQL